MTESAARIESYSHHIIYGKLFECVWGNEGKGGGGGGVLECRIVLIRVWEIDLDKMQFWR